MATAQQGLNEPRYPSLPGIMKAKKMPLKCLLDLSEDLTVQTFVLDQYLPPKKQAGRILEGDIEQQVQEFVHLLRNEGKVV